MCIFCTGLYSNFISAQEYHTKQGKTGRHRSKYLSSTFDDLKYRRMSFLSNDGDNSTDEYHQMINGSFIPVRKFDGEQKQTDDDSDLTSEDSSNHEDISMNEDNEHKIITDKHSEHLITKMYVYDISNTYK